MSNLTEEEEKTQIEVRVGSYTTQDPDPTDPFLVSNDDLKKISGFSTNVKRKVSRDLKKGFSGDGANSRQLEEQIITGYNLFDVVSPPYHLDHLAALYEISAPHYAAVRAKVSNIVALGYEFIESSASKEKLENLEEEKKEAAQRKLRKGKRSIQSWLDSKNKNDEFSETLIKVWTDYETTGNGYLEIGRKITGEIGYIGHVSSLNIRVRRARDGFVQLIANQARFFRNYQDENTGDPLGKDIRPNEIIHFKKYTPTNSYYGIPDIVSAQQAIAGNEFASRYNLDYFENKAVPRYLITLKGGVLGPGSERQMLEFFQNNLKNTNHRTLFVPLPDDTADSKVEFKMEAVEATVQDSSFNDYLQHNLKEILMANGVPASKVSMPDGGTLAAARDASATFKEQVCRPEQKNIEKKINKIILEVTDAFEFKLKELTLTDEVALAQMDQIYLTNKTMVPNDIRVDRWGWSALPDGDEPIDLKSDVASEAISNATDARSRDQRRAAAPGPDSAISPTGRAPKGGGRVTE